MEIFYWILEYFKVNITYMLLVFVWPSILFHKFLKKKSFTFRFMFCAVSSVFLLNSVVMVLGLLHILYAVVFRILFYGSIAVSLYMRIPNKKDKITEAGRVLAGSYGVKQMFFNLFRNSIDQFDRSIKDLKNKIKGHRIEYGTLALVLLFGMVYFTYGSVQNHSYGFGDMYVHSSWIYGLTQGKIFSSGIYPEGMHCLIYSMHVLFGVRLFSGVLYTGPVHMLVIMVSVYIFLKEIFRSKYTPMFALTIFLTLDVLCIDEIYGMSRFQWTIPMEFGMAYAFMCAASLIRYLRFGSSESRILDNIYKKRNGSDKKRKFIYNDELLIFTIALVDTVISHFYASGMAFFLCLAVVPLSVLKLFNPKRLIPLIMSVVTVLVLAIAPMALAFASGIQFEKSIGWAMSVIEGEEKDADENGNMVSVSGGDRTSQEQSQDGSHNDGEGSTGDKDISSEYELDENDTRSPYSDDAQLQQTENSKSFSERISGFFDSLYRYGYETLYRHDRGNLVIGLTIAAFIIFLICKIANVVYVIRSGDDSMRMSLFDGYFIIALASVLFMILYSAEGIGLPSLFARSRLCGIERFLLCGVCAVPFDIAFLIIDKYFPDIVFNVLGAIVTASIYLVILVSGSFHGYLYCEFTRYNAAVNVSESITKDMDRNKFTIVSTVDELYQTIEYGFHEELVQFINDCVEKDYTLPTEYVFIFYEKKPLKYAQFNFFAGPGWLAEEKYASYYDRETGSQYPNYITSTASPEIATGPFYKFPVSSKSYKDWLTRTVLESRMQKWVTDFNNLYPNELHTYYEDEHFVCYYFRQNPACLYQLGFEIDDSRNNFVTSFENMTEQNSSEEHSAAEETETEEETEGSLQDAG